MFVITIWQGGWQPTESFLEHVWMNPDRWDFWTQTTRPCIMGHKIINPKCSEVPLMDNHPTKSIKICKRRLFDTIPAEILSIINNLAIRFKYNDKRIAIIN